MLDLQGEWDEASLADFLGSRRLLAGSCVVRVEHWTTRRRSALVSLSDGRALFIKHCPEAHDEGERSLLRLLHGSAGIPAGRAPAYLLFDEVERVLVTEGLRDHVPLHTQLDRDGFDNLGLMNELGVALGRLHEATREQPSLRGFAAVPGYRCISTYGHVTPRQLADAPGSEYPLFLRAAQRMNRALRQARDGWQPRCLIHGDFKADNILIGPGGALRFIDWELAAWGDPLWDVGTFSGHCVFRWLGHVRASASGGIADWLRGAEPPLAVVRRALAAFWQAYRATAPALAVDGDAGRVIRYAAVFLLTRGAASLCTGGSLSGAAFLALEVAEALLRDLDLGVSLFLGPGAARA